VTEHEADSSNSFVREEDVDVFVSTVLVVPSPVVTELPPPPSSPQAASRPLRLTAPKAARAWRRSIL
jgi:hypothetical protein